MAVEKELPTAVVNYKPQNLVHRLRYKRKRVCAWEVDTNGQLRLVGPFATLVSSKRTRQNGFVGLFKWWAVGARLPSACRPLALQKVKVNADREARQQLKKLVGGRATKERGHRVDSRCLNEVGTVELKPKDRPVPNS